MLRSSPPPMPDQTWNLAIESFSARWVGGAKVEQEQRCNTEAQGGGGGGVRESSTQVRPGLQVLQEIKRGASAASEHDSPS